MDRRQFLQSVISTGLASGYLAGGARRLQAQGMLSRGVPPEPRPKFSGKPFPVSLLDVSGRAGLTVPTIYGSNRAKPYIFEANGPGIAFLDYDDDGWLDIFLPSGERLAGSADGQEPTNHLYHNNRDGTFTDVTSRARLKHSGWCYGACVGDYDNDGHEDLFLTFYGKNVLYHNNGDGTFSDVTKEAGLGEDETRFATGCTFLDYDRDGHLDLFVSRYVGINLKTIPVAGSSRFCKFRDVSVACGPRGLPKETCSLYHNNGNGTFIEVTSRSGLLKPGGRYGLSAVAFDYNDDGWPDVFVACDSTPNLLFQNNHDGTFTDVALEAGCAVNGDGQVQANMGVALGDYDADGYPDLFVTHFSDDSPTLFHNFKGKFFEDLTYAAGLAVETRYVCWGTGFCDLDNDGWLDLFVVTGSIYPEAEKLYPDYKFKTPRMAFRNLGNGRFEEVTNLCGPAVLEPHSSRGCAFGDFDNDGNVDILILNMGEPPSLLKNQNRSGNHWLAVKCVGAKSNRSAIGAKVRVIAGGREQIREVASGSSYISQSDLRQYFGLGKNERAERVEIHWPSGIVAQLANVKADQIIALAEGSAQLKR